ncbi:MAG: ribokinase [Caldisericaceae bacterium]
MRKKVIVLGSVNVDLVLYSDKLPEKGETVFGNEFLINQGGKGANQAVAASKAGAEVIFIGRVGDDFFGRFVLDSLRSFGVNSHLFVDKTSTTGVALINVDKSGENAITIIKGANGLVGDSEVDFLKQAINSGDILLLQGEISTETLVAACKISQGVGANVIFDPAPVREDLLDVVPFATYVTPNEIELKKLTKSNTADELLKAGAKNVILKLGSSGVKLVNRNTQIALDAFSVDAIDTTGAGDAFNGSFAAALAMEYDLKDALKFAVAASAISVTRKGAAASSPTYDEIMKFIKEKK